MVSPQKHTKLIENHNRYWNNPQSEPHWRQLYGSNQETV
jgi:hypothetical protein